MRRKISLVPSAELFRYRRRAQRAVGDGDDGRDVGDDWSYPEGYLEKIVTSTEPFWNLSTSDGTHSVAGQTNTETSRKFSYPLASSASLPSLSLLPSASRFETSYSRRDTAVGCGEQIVGQRYNSNKNNNGGDGSNDTGPSIDLLGSKTAGGKREDQAYYISAAWSEWAQRDEVVQERNRRLQPKVELQSRRQRKLHDLEELAVGTSGVSSSSAIGHSSWESASSSRAYESGAAMDRDQEKRNKEGKTPEDTEKEHLPMEVKHSSFVVS